MKNLLLLSLTILLFSCGDSKQEEEQVEDCGCYKTFYRGYFANSSSSSYTEEVTGGSSNVPCVDEEVKVITQSNSDETLFYVICCDNIFSNNAGAGYCD